MKIKTIEENASINRCSFLTRASLLGGAALLPFVDATAAGNAGLDTSVSFDFKPFTPTLPSPLGDFISFGG